MSDIRLPAPGARYDPENERAFRRAVEQAISRASFQLSVGAGIVYEEGGALKYKSPAGTVTILAPA
jgi:hypothetical protein